MSKPVPTGAMLAAAMVAGALLPAQAAAAATPKAEPKVKVVATLTQVADLVKSIGRDNIDLYTILKPADEPDHHDITPADKAAIAASQVVFISGIAVDDWIKPTLDELGANGKVVDTSQRVATIAGDPASEPIDPHWWYDPENATIALRTIAGGLSKANQEDAGYFRKNLAKETKAYHRLDDRVERLFAKTPANKRIFTSTIDALPYFLHHFGVKSNPDAAAPPDSVAPTIDDNFHVADPDKVEQSDIAWIKKVGACKVFVDSFNKTRKANIEKATGATFMENVIVGDGIGTPGPGATIRSALLFDAEQMASGFGCDSGADPARAH